MSGGGVKGGSKNDPIVVCYPSSEGRHVVAPLASARFPPSIDE